MAIKHALINLFQKFSDRATLERPDLSVRFGWREPSKTMQGTCVSRVEFVPGIGSFAGDFSQPRNDVPGMQRVIINMWERATIHVYAYDPASPEDESLQYSAVRSLVDYVISSIYADSYGTFELIKSSWEQHTVERRSGAKMVLELKLRSPVIDVYSPVKARLKQVNVTANELDSELSVEIR